MLILYAIMSYYFVAVVFETVKKLKRSQQALDSLESEKETMGSHRNKGKEEFASEIKTSKPQGMH